MPVEVVDVERVSQSSGIHTFYFQSRGFPAAFLLYVFTLKYL